MVFDDRDRNAIAYRSNANAPIPFATHLRCANYPEIIQVLDKAYDYLLRLLAPPPAPPPRPLPVPPDGPPPRNLTTLTPESIDAVRQILDERNVDDQARRAVWLLMEVDRQQAMAVTFKLLKKGLAGDAVQNPSNFLLLVATMRCMEGVRRRQAACGHLAQHGIYSDTSTPTHATQVALRHMHGRICLLRACGGARRQACMRPLVSLVCTAPRRHEHANARSTGGTMRHM